MITILIELTLSYSYKDEKEKKKISKFAIINCAIGVPTIAFLILLMVKGFLVDFIALTGSAIGLLSLGIVYSIYKIIRK